MMLLIVLLMISQIGFAQEFRVHYPESSLRCGDQDLIDQDARRFHSFEECEDECSNDPECKLFFVIKEGRENKRKYDCYYFKSCNYVISYDRVGTTYSKENEPDRSVKNADSIYDSLYRGGACARKGSDGEEWGVFAGGVIVPHDPRTLTMEKCQYHCMQSATCTGYWWLNGEEEEDKQCVIYDVEIEETNEHNGHCMIRQFHPLSPKEDVAVLLQLIPKRLEKLVVLVRRQAKRAKKWCEKTELVQSEATDACLQYMEIIDDFLALPEEVALKKDDVPAYDVDDNPIKTVATLLRQLKPMRNKFTKLRDDGVPNRHAEGIFEAEEEFHDNCVDAFMEPLERITRTQVGQWSLFHINSEVKHDTRNVLLLKAVFEALEASQEDDYEGFYWMEPLLFGYHQVVKHYKEIGWPREDGSFDYGKFVWPKQPRED